MAYAILMRSSLNAIKMLAGHFLLPLTNLPEAFISMDKASRSFHPDLFPSNFANVFLTKLFVPNINWGKFFQNGETGDEGVDNSIMDLINGMDIQDWNLLMDTKFRFELKDSESDIYFQSLEIQALIKITVGTSSEDNTYASLTDPILK